MEPQPMVMQPATPAIVQPAGGLDAFTVVLIIAAVIIIAGVALSVMNRNQARHFEERFGGTTVLHSGSNFRRRHHRTWAIIRACFAGLRKQLESVRAGH